MAKKTPKRKILFPIMSRIHYARQKHLLDLLNKNPKVELQLVVGGSVLLDKYGERFLPAIQKAGFTVNETLFNVIDGGGHIAMAKTAGLTALEFSNALYKLNPDIVLIRGDRFEQLAVAMVAAYLNKTVAHIEGGDLSGTIDESVRHAITKLAHIHFVTNEDARRRVIQMGENPKTVFNVGSPDVEFAALVDSKLDGSAVNKSGLGHRIDLKKPFLIVMQHPVTTEKNNRRNMEETLKAIDKVNIQTVVFWPNSDAGTNDISKAIRVYREHGRLKNQKIRFVTDLLPEDFIALLRRSAALIGNSSAGIKESSVLGVPVVNIGTRQNNRLRDENVVDVSYKAADIEKAVRKQIEHGKYPVSRLYHQPQSSQKIVQVLTKIKLNPQKKFHETIHESHV
ncbi:MAG: UDP-N-acetylglucosamine 2-epimerase [Parcubacteria group bacterium Gr01-1014_3]|nr:MAG: UDP-N-acetylglucosamine 2-epimerase [Parcubacteria group bacterium Gr01-1014_3]